MHPLTKASAERFSLPFSAATRGEITLTPEWARASGDATTEEPEEASVVDPTCVWDIVSHSATSVSLQATLPVDHDLVALRRTFAADPARPAVAVRTQVVARRRVQLPLGFELCFAVPAASGTVATTVVPPEFEFGTVHPAETLPTAAASVASVLRASPGASFDSLSTVPRRVAGGPGSVPGGADLPLNLTSLPLPHSDGGGEAETVSASLQLCTVADGSFALEHPQAGYKVSLDWDASVLPSLLLHIDTSAEHAQRIRVAPVVSAFDLGSAISKAHNPLQSRGVATTRIVEPGKAGKLETRYTIAASACVDV